MALIPRPTGFLENPLNQTLFGNNKEIATAGTTDADATNTNQINLLPGSLATGIAVTDTLELTSPAKLKFQTDAVIQVGAGNNLVMDGVPVAGVAPTNVLYYNTTNQRVTYGAAPSSGAAWSTIPSGANVNMNGNSLTNADVLNFDGTAPVDMTMGAYTATVANQVDLVADTTQLISATTTDLTVQAQAPNDEINFNGAVALANGLQPNSFVSYNPSGTEWGLATSYTAGSTTSVNNIQGPAFSVFAQTAPNTTVAVPAVVGETYLAVDSQNRIQWLTQNTQALNPNDMFPENTQTSLAVGATATGKYRTTVVGSDGLIYCTPTNTAPQRAATIDPTTDTVVSLNAYDITASNANPRYTVSAGTRIYHIPLSPVTAGPAWFWPIYDTLTKTLDISVAAGWANGAGPICGALGPTERFIYLPPFAETGAAGPNRGERVRKFDTVTNTFIEVGANYTASVYQNNKWGTATLAPNGNIYCFPFNARINVPPSTPTVLVIDTVTDATTIVNLTGVTAGATMYYSSCLSPDGNFIYVSPLSATNVLKFNWRTNTFSQPAGLAVGAFGGAKYSGLAAAPNGLIYMFPQDATVIQVINPATDTFVASIPVPNNAVAAKFGDCCLGPNGKVYCAPFSANDGAGNALGSIVKTGIPTIPTWMLGPGTNQQ